MKHELDTHTCELPGIPSAHVPLPSRPRIYGAGDDLPVGTYTVAHCAGGRFTVVRQIGAQRWYPLTARENPTWKLWSSLEACAADVMDDDNLFTCADWPHWGRA